VNVTYTEEALADILDAIAYLNERNPAAASNLDTDLSACIEHLAAGEFEGPLSASAPAPLCGVGPFSRSGSTTSASQANC
jgi:plasmid stabilization system protein ParE